MTYADKLKANEQLQQAVYKGLIFKPHTCQKCHRRMAWPQIHGHHWDYRKPFSVSWLCATCHHKVHNFLRWANLCVDWLEHCQKNNIPPEDAKLPAHHKRTGAQLPGVTQLDYWMKQRGKKQLNDALRYAGLLQE